MEQNLTFADLGLSEEILQALEKKGYGYPTRIQAEAPDDKSEATDTPKQTPRIGASALPQGANQGANLNLLRGSNDGGGRGKVK